MIKNETGGNEMKKLINAGGSDGVDSSGWKTLISYEDRCYACGTHIDGTDLRFVRRETHCPQCVEMRSDLTITATSQAAIWYETHTTLYQI
jgi:hypothetical protein